MRILRYERDLIKRQSFELEEYLGGFKRWVRVEINGSLSHWHPVEEESYTASEEEEKELESKYYHQYKT
jgi:hypothetical protein